MHFLPLLFMVLIQTADAKQTKHAVDKNSNQWHFDIKWKDGSGKVQTAAFSLNADTIKTDIKEPLHFKINRSSQFQAQQINRWSKNLKGVKVTATAKDGKVSIRASGKGLVRVRKKLREAKEVGENAADTYVEDNGYTYLKGKVVPDHLQHVREYSNDLKPLVEALGGPTPNPRVFAAKALSFSQAIPYEKRSRKADKYRRPLSMIGRNKGDCDSKTVLFLSLMHQAYPKMPLAVVYIPGHAFGAIGIEPERGDTSFRSDGQRWVAVEPVGPAMLQLGKVGGKSRRRIRIRGFSILSI